MKQNHFKTGFLKLLIVILFQGIGKFSFAIENHPAGARSSALSNASVSFSDLWATFHNQAGIAAVSEFSAGFFYESRFGIDLLSLSAGSVVLPSGNGAFGVSFFQFGKKSYKENKLGVAYALQLSEKWSAGIQLDYIAGVFPENVRHKGFATFETGVIYRPADKLHFGAHLFNPVKGGIQTVAGKQEMPVVFRAGGNYCFGEMVLFAFEAEKENKNPALVKAGIEFLPAENLFLRIGASGRPFKYTAGFGYKTEKISADIGFGYHANLGTTPSVSIQFQL